MKTITHYPRNIPNDGSALLIGGLPLSRILQRAGSTPAYVYDRALVEQRVAELRHALPEKINLHYAVKANPMLPLISYLLDLVDGFDVASKGELLSVLNAGARPSAISFAGPGKTDEELRLAIACEVCISVESSTELTRCSRIASEIAATARVCLRINPNFELRSSGMKMTGHPSQFGIDVAEVEEMIRAKPLANTRFVGVQIYSGSQNLNTDALIEASNQTLDLVSNLVLAMPSSLEFANIGGGYGIPYFAHEKPFDLGAVAAALDEKITSLDSSIGDTKLVLELGRYIVGEAGYYLATVIDIKVSQGKKFVVVDGGMHHHLANSGNFGQTLRKNYPVIVANKMNFDAAEKITIVGPLCTPLDIVASDIEAPIIELGDQIAVMQSGAYGYTASPLKFLGHNPPIELLV